MPITIRQAISFQEFQDPDVELVVRKRRRRFKGRPPERHKSGEDSGITDPTDIASNINWWDCSDTSTITLGTGNDAISIDDKIDAATLLALVGAPQSGTRTVNALNTLDFDGVNDAMAQKAVNATMPLWELGSASAVHFRGRLASQDASFTTVTASDISRNGLHLWEVEFDPIADTATLRFDGAQIAQAVDYTGTTEAHIFCMVEVDGVSNANDAFLGNDGTDGVYWGQDSAALQFGDVAICESTISDKVLTDADLTNMRSYFDRWLVTFMLKADGSSMMLKADGSSRMLKG